MYKTKEDFYVIASICADLSKECCNHHFFVAQVEALGFNYDKKADCYFLKYGAVTIKAKHTADGMSPIFQIIKK